jgi:hypothetical protein
MRWRLVSLLLAGRLSVLAVLPLPARISATSPTADLLALPALVVAMPAH